MLGSISAFIAMAIATRQIKGVHDTFEILAFRSVVGFVLVVAVGLMTGQISRIRRDRLGGHALRNMFHFTGQSLWFWAVTAIPLAQVFALEFTSPIWVILLSPLVLGERLTRMKLLAAAFGFTGVLIVAHPDFSDPNLGVLAAAGSAVFFASTTLMSKRLTKDEAVIGILFWLVLIGVAGVTAHLCVTNALALAPASKVVPVDFARLPVIAVVGALAYDEPVAASLFLGAGLIFVGIWITLRPAPAKA